MWLQRSSAIACVLQPAMWSACVRERARRAVQERCDAISTPLAGALFKDQYAHCIKVEAADVCDARIRALTACATMVSKE